MYRRKSIEGSNPSLSANKKTRTCGFFYWRRERVARAASGSTNSHSEFGRRRRPAGVSMRLSAGESIPLVKLWRTRTCGFFYWRRERVARAASGSTNSHSEFGRRRRPAGVSMRLSAGESIPLVKLWRTRTCGFFYWRRERVARAAPFLTPKRMRLRCASSRVDAWVFYRRGRAGSYGWKAIFSRFGCHHSTAWRRSSAAHQHAAGPLNGPRRSILF